MGSRTHDFESQGADSDTLIVRGGRALSGRVRIGGYKHAMVPMIAASVLARDPVHLDNVPDLEDRRVLSSILESLGATVRFAAGSLEIDAGALRPQPIDDSASSRVHGSMYLIPTLLGRFGAVDIGRSGGCAFDRSDAHGARPIHHIISVLERFGARFDVAADRVVGRLDGGRYRAARVSVLDYYDDPIARTGPLASGAVKAALLAAAVADGVSVIEHPLRTPEVAELIAFLRSAGVAIEDAGEALFVEGRDHLSAATHALMSDPMEAFTYIGAAMYTDSPLVLTSLTTSRLQRALACELDVLSRMGARVEWRDDGELHLAPPVDRWRAVDVEVRPDGTVHPDNQPLCSLLLLRADGGCRVVDRVWGNRFAHVPELRRLGADLDADTHCLRTRPGRPHVGGLRVRGADLRCTSVLVVAALGIRGTTTIDGARHLGRGYDDFVGNLARLGADVRPGGPAQEAA